MVLNSDIINATKIAPQIDEKWKNWEPINHEVNSNIKPLRTKLNNPKVKILIGNDKIQRIGLTSTFSIDKTKLAKTAAPKLLK